MEKKIIFFQSRNTGIRVIWFQIRENQIINFAIWHRVRMLSGQFLIYQFVHFKDNAPVFDWSTTIKWQNVNKKSDRATS